MRPTSGELSVEQQLKLLEENAPRLAVRERGRPPSVSAEFRENGYRDENGRYQFEAGLKPWHERIVEFLILNPAAKQVDVARAFGVSPCWVGQIIRSDAFQEFYRAEMQKHRERVSEEIIDRVQNVTLKSMKAIEKKVDAQGDMMRVTDLASVAKLGLTALGYGGAGVKVNIHNDERTLNVVGVDPEVLQAAREKNARLRRDNEQLRHDKGEKFDAHGYVTASLSLGGSDDGEDAVEDAEILNDDDR